MARRKLPRGGGLDRIHYIERRRGQPHGGAQCETSSARPPRTKCEI
jgi:hypothetical protein